MYKLRYVCMLMLQDSIDVFVLIDTRYSTDGLKAYVKKKVLNYKDYKSKTHCTTKARLNAHGEAYV